MHLPVHLPCYDLPLLCSIYFLFNNRVELGESDGRCVRASEPVSREHSIFCLLLNPPLGTGFTVQFVYSELENVAHFFPAHALHLDLTFWVLPILLIMRPSQDKLATVVYRRGEQGLVRLSGGYRL